MDPGNAQTVLRMALAMMAADVRSALIPRQRQWIIDRLRAVDEDECEIPLTPEECGRVVPSLLLWADTFRAEVGTVLRRALEGGAATRVLRVGEQAELLERPHHSFAPAARSHTHIPY
jgi:hypothetical protein